MTTAPQVALDCIELWVGDLDRMQHLLTTAFGFEAEEHFRETGQEKAMALASGEVRVVLRQGTTPQSPVARHVGLHGDTVGDVVLACPDPGATVERALAFGLAVFGPSERPTIDLLGGRTVCHSLRSRTDARDLATENDQAPRLRAVDHVAYCLPFGSTERVARAYEAVFGLEQVDVGDCEEVGEGDIGMRSAVLRSAGGFTVVLTEPSTSASTGQTQRFIDAHAGPGVQHAAIACDDLIQTVSSLRSRGVQFLPVPRQYFDDAEMRLHDVAVPWNALRRLEILVDRDEQGLLFQLFTRSLSEQPTFFLELIQRVGASGFGANNVRALFAAVQAAAVGSSD